MDVIQKISLVDEAYKRIKQEILSDKFSEGSLIPSENQLCKDLNVSRVVIREALSRLRNEKIIVTYQGKGSYRANPQNFMRFDFREQTDIDKFINVMDFRLCIELSALKTAVKVATDMEIASIVDCARKMATAIDNKEFFNECDYEFHLRIIKSSLNQLYVQAIENNKDLIKHVLSIMNGLIGSYNYALELHQKIAERFCARDLKAIEELLKSNEDYNIARMKEILKAKV